MPSSFVVFSTKNWRLSASLIFHFVSVTPSIVAPSSCWAVSVAKPSSVSFWPVSSVRTCSASTAPRIPSWSGSWVKVAAVENSVAHAPGSGASMKRSVGRLDSAAPVAGEAKITPPGMPSSEIRSCCMRWVVFTWSSALPCR